MATLVDVHLAGLSNGSSLTTGTGGTGDNTVSSVQGTAPTVFTTDVDKTPMMRVNVNSSTASAVYYNFSSTKTQTRARFYFKTPSAWPSAASPIIGYKLTTASTTDVARFTMAGSGNPGQVRIQNTSSANAYSSANNVLSLNTLYRVEFIVNQTAGTARAIVYAGESGTSILDTGNVSSSYAATMGRVFIGKLTTSPAVDMLMGHLTVTDDIATEIGQYPPIVSGPVVTVWNGSAEVPATVKVWNGSTEVAGTISLV